MTLSITKPIPGDSSTSGTWGSTLNNALDTVVSAVNGNTDAIATVNAALANKAPSSGIDPSAINGLVAALASKATPADISAAIGALTAGTPAELDTFLEAYNRFLADESNLSNLTTLVAGKYVKPVGGIPAADLAAAVQSLLGIDQTARDNLTAETSRATAAEATKDPSGLPSYVPTGLTRQYDALRSAYGCNSVVMGQIRSALSKARVGLGLAHILAIGDSQTAGNMGSLSANPRDQEHAYPMMLRAALVNSGVPLAGTGMKAPSACRQTQAQPNPPWTFTGTWSATWISKCTTVGGIATLTATAAEGLGTNVDIAYLDQAAANTFTYTIKDSGGATLTSGTVTPTGTNIIKVLSLTGLVGVKSLDITAGTANCQILAANIYRTTGLLVHNLAFDGTTATGTAGWADNTTIYYGPETKVAVPAPDLVIGTLGGNDELSAVATAANMTAIGSSYNRWANTSHIQIGQWQSNSRTAAQWNTFVGAQYAMADSAGIGLFDAYNRTGGYATMLARGTITDAGVTHPNQSAHAELGNALGLLLTA
jgi:hypothetical protein